MKHNIDIPPAIQWHEGMLVGPQHFQQAFIRQENLLHYSAKNICPFYWGTQKLEINKNMLVSGVLQVDELEAIMPDGLEVSYLKTEEEKDELKINLEPYKEELAKKDLTVFLAIPAQLSAQGGGKGELERYKSDKGDLIKDENTGDNPILIPRLKPALSLMITDELSAKYVGFPLTKITFKDANFALTGYAPPALNISTLPDIEEIGMEVVKQLREKANFLAEKIQAISSDSGMAMIMEVKEQVRSVVSALPQFETVLRSPELHPYYLYQAVALLVGNLASLDPGLIPPILPAYNHNELLNIFTTAKNYIFRITEQGIQEKYIQYPFTYSEDEYTFSLKMEDGWLTDEIIIGMRGQPGMALEDLIEWANKCLIGSESLMPSMRERRISGLLRRPVKGNENLIPLKGVQLFSMTVDPEFALPNEKLMLLNLANQLPGTMRAEEVVLYVETPPTEPKDDSQ